MITKNINSPSGKKYEEITVPGIVYDDEPIEGSFNGITSDAVVKAIDEAKEDMQGKIDEVTLDPSAVALGNVHLLDEVTEFAADAGVLVDSATDGPGEMSKDTLLQLTAQNALAGNVASEFVPNSTTTIAGNLYVYNGSLYVAKEAYQGPWDASKFETIKIADCCLVKINNPDTSSAPFNDLNTFPVNTSVMVSGDVSGIANKPTNSLFTCITLSNSASFAQQIFIDAGKRLFVRQKFSTWGEWKCLVNENLPIQIIINPDTSSVPYNDLNSFPVNTFALVASNPGNVLHKPEANPVMVLTIGTTENNAIQFALVNGNKHVYLRSKWGDWTDWVRTDLNGINYSINPDTYSSPYNDLNSYPKNEFALVTYQSSNVSNRPTSGDFQVYTWGLSDNVIMQIYMSSSNEIYMRTKWINWSSWKNIASSILPIQIKVNPDTSSSPYNDADTFPQNEFVLISTGYDAVLNIPDSNVFFIVTLSASNSARLQLFCSSTGEIFVRSKVISWSGWRNIDEPSKLPCDILSAFTNILCVGDSLTWGHVYTTATLSGSRQAYKPYPTVLGVITGATITMNAAAGDSATMCWDRYNADFVAKTNALAIIYLGTNEGLTDTLDVDAPENTSYESWATTNTGSYAKIVAKLQSLGYKILLIKPFAVSQTASLEDTHKAIEDIANRFGCSVVGPIYSEADEYHYWPNRQGRNGGHYNDLGYSWFAHRLVDVVATLGDNLKWIIPE